jgi:hypothetical protein
MNTDFTGEYLNPAMRWDFFCPHFWEIQVDNCGKGPLFHRLARGYHFPGIPFNPNTVLSYHYLRLYLIVRLESYRTAGSAKVGTFFDVE